MFSDMGNSRPTDNRPPVKFTLNGLLLITVFGRLRGVSQAAMGG
ncbi:hypothetical protein A0123_00160 [Gluconobacter cerinus]|uniref:Uncharacterized protein n=1 Tax=Gluconobacter cerinus TaxID=38307 RepID=A0A1B6VPG2_9PROT|nr:hypothetical protein A0123_00160 [Gluconobacter cerinus]